ncbi:MAG: ROK family protein [Betaproteobacteria bacterium]|nr:ROK family protein [Betaproteobacteria bacterium]
MHRIGIDLGGTKIEGVILDENSAEIYRERTPTEAERGYRHILSRIAMLYGRMQARVANAPHTLGIGTPGSISPRTGLLRNSNTVALNGQPFIADLEQFVGRKFVIANDANCFALAEAILGAARGYPTVFGVIMGTGTGGGIVFGGTVHTGRTAIAGEWGHTSIDPQGPLCYCGTRGCVETYLSGSGIENRFFEQTGRRSSAMQIFAAASAHDPAATAVIDAFYAHFGRAMANVINVVDPDIVVLGGGVSNVGGLYDRGVSAVRCCVFADYFDTPIVKNQLGSSSGVIGAALIGC